MPEVLIIDELPLVTGAGRELEGAPGDQRRLVGEAGKMDVGLGVEFRHLTIIERSRS
jgi:hypothetical protein